MFIGVVYFYFVFVIPFVHYIIVLQPIYNLSFLYQFVVCDIGSFYMCPLAID